MLKTTTVRLPPDLDKGLTEYAKREDISKNQAMKKAVRLLLGQQPEKTARGGVYGKRKASDERAGKAYDTIAIRLPEEVIKE